MTPKLLITKERDEHLKTGETWSYRDKDCPKCGLELAHARELETCSNVFCDYKNYEVIDGE